MMSFGSPLSEEIKDLIRNAQFVYIGQLGIPKQLITNPRKKYVPRARSILRRCSCGEISNNWRCPACEHLL